MGISLLDMWIKTARKETGFKISNTFQTVFGKIDEINKTQNVLVGYGQGSFVVIRAQKK